MCGIAGIVGSSKDYRVDAGEIHRMCQMIVHRGPDDEGIYTRNCIGLGMRRLSIIDLSTGHQPVHNEDGMVSVVFNGEIYNFQELRKELEARGHRFYTNTDTEVIVHLYENYGSECVRLLRGMFAFALWDHKNQRLLLARDRFGKKPLYYALTRDRLLFGSEIRSLLAVCAELADLDTEGILNFFSFGYIPDPLTAFSRIHKLPPGYLLEFSNGHIQKRQYWDLPVDSEYEPSSEEECLEQMQEHLAEAVRIRLISDVPLGALLSGGVDSSTVVALMSRAGLGKIKTFSIGFAHQDFNEAEYARAVARHFGTEHHEFVVDPDIEETINRLTALLEEPFGDSSIVPTYHVSRLARQHVTVVLSGDGGDELLAGYDRYTTQLRRQWMRFLPMFPFGTAKWYRNYMHPLLPASWPGRRFTFNLTLPPEDRYLDSISVLPVGTRESALFSEGFIEQAQRSVSPYERFRQYLAKAPADELRQMLYLDTKTYLPGDILTKVDRMSMANSLEARSPFLDHRFAEWSARLSARWKLRGGEQKYILKKLAERLGVPRDVLYRKKKGFSMPLVHWFRQKQMPALLEILSESRTIQRGYFKERGVRQKLFEHRKGIRDRSYELWHLLVFELWHRNFLEPALANRQIPAWNQFMPSATKMEGDFIRGRQTAA